MQIEILRKKRRYAESNRLNKSWIDRGIYIQEVEIETVNRCNGTCPFCPVNANQPQREYKKMSVELFERIIDELADMNYSGNISLYSNNEPLLDERIVDFHKYAWEKLPHAKHCLFTNGTLLNINTFLKLIPYLDYLHIDNYNDEKKVNQGLKEVFDYLQTHELLKEKVEFAFRLQNEVLSSRGGQAPNKQKAKRIPVICLLPYRQLVIRPDGKISLCCNDALGKYTLGDLNEESIMQIWNSPKYQEIRDKMYRDKRKGLLLCEYCDTTTKPFPEKGN